MQGNQSYVGYGGANPQMRMASPGLYTLLVNYEKKEKLRGKLKDGKGEGRKRKKLQKIVVKWL